MQANEYGTVKPRESNLFIQGGCIQLACISRFSVYKIIIFLESVETKLYWYVLQLIVNSWQPFGDSGFRGMIKNIGVTTRYSYLKL